jgi:serine protease
MAAMAAFASVSSMSDSGPVRRAPHLDASAQPGRVIVKLKERAHTLSAATNGGVRFGPQSAALFASRMNIALADGRILGSRTQVLKSTSLNSRDLATRLAQDPDVEWAVVDERRFALGVPPNDPLYPQGVVGTTPAVGQWYLRAPGGLGNPGVASGVNVEPAWTITYGDGVVIADLDTGITVHPDLQNKLFYNGTVPYGYDFIGFGPGEGQDGILTANDGNGADPDPSDPGDWITAAENANKSGAFYQCAGTDPSDFSNSSWHGTQTAGILAAQTDNGAGMAGVARNAMLVPVRVLGKCGGYDSDIQAGMQWAAGIAVAGVPTNLHPARILNMSLGGSSGEACPSSYQDVFNQLAALNVMAVVAAGNDEGLAVGVPANCTGAIAVAALRHQGDKVGFSDIGPQVAIAAPGGNCVNTDSSQACLYPILTTANTGTMGPVAPTYTNSFGEVSVGTSFATPIVSGTIALMLAANPGLTNAQVLQMLQSSATPFPTSGGAGTGPCQAPSSTVQDACYCTTTTCGAGMLNAAGAVGLAAGVTGAVATISTPAAPDVGQAVTLDSAGSQPSAGATITNYDWTITQGASLVTVSGSASGPTATTLTLQTLGAGTVTVKLVVTDSAGLVGVSFRTFATSAPTAVISGPTSLAPGASIQLSATGSAGGGSNAIQSYQWTVTSGTSIVSLAAPTNQSSVTVTGTTAGTAVVQLVVTDSAGQTATTSTTLTVASTSSGGGGAANPLWLLALAIGGLALAPRRLRGKSR